MKISIYILSIFIFLSCNENQKTTIDEGLSTTITNNEKSTDFLEFQKNADDFMPTQIDLSKVLFLENYDIEYFISKKEFQKKLETVFSKILLKQYLFQLENSNQGYDLLGMRSGNAKLIIDYFLELNSINNTREFVNSAAPFYITIEKNNLLNNIVIADLIASIEREHSRINEESLKIINNADD